MEFGKCQGLRAQVSLLWEPIWWSQGRRKEPVGGGGEGWAARHLNTWLLFHSWLCGLQCLAQVPSQAALSTAPLPPQESPCSPQTVLPPPPPPHLIPRLLGLQSTVVPLWRPAPGWPLKGALALV